VLPGPGLAFEELLKHHHHTGRHVDPGFSMLCLPSCKDTDTNSWRETGQGRCTLARVMQLRLVSARLAPTTSRASGCVRSGPVARRSR